MIKIARTILSFANDWNRKVNVPNSKLSHSLSKIGNSFGGRLAWAYFRPRYVLRILLFLGIANTLVMLSLMVVSVIAASIKGHLISSGYSSWLSSVPVSLEDVLHTLSMLFQASIMWSLVVTFNHWNDIVSLVMQLPSSDWISLVSAAASYWWVINVSTLSTFFSVLWENPMSIGNTMFIQEWILMGDNFIAALSSVFDWVLSFNFTPHTLIQLVKDMTISGLKWLGQSTSSILGTGWNWIVVTIHGFIGPADSGLFSPLIQPVTHKVSQLLAGYIIWLLIRWFIGF
jgi:hypothetical protein